MIEYCAAGWCLAVYRLALMLVSRHLQSCNHAGVSPSTVSHSCWCLAIYRLALMLVSRHLPSRTHAGVSPFTVSLPCWCLAIYCPALMLMSPLLLSRTHAGVWQFTVSPFTVSHSCWCLAIYRLALMTEIREGWMNFHYLIKSILFSGNWISLYFFHTLENTTILCLLLLYFD